MLGGGRRPVTLVEGTKEQRTVLEKSVLDDRGVYGERGRRGEAREEEGWEHRGEISGAKLIKKKKSSVWLAAENRFYIWVLLEALQISVVCSSWSL